MLARPSRSVVSLASLGKSTVGHPGPSSGFLALIARCAVSALIAASGAASPSSAAALPLDDGGKFLGVKQCSSSQCHGAVAGTRETRVRFNEYRVWQREDPHATRAYEVLKTKRSAQIVERLGLGTSADSEPRCLSCHSTNVPDALQGRTFDPKREVTSGITCEACHGGADDWITSHTRKDVAHAANLKSGMYPTDQAERRAELCLSCHLGDGESRRFVTHRMMAAGHPRIGFELATFTLTQPAHFVVDRDYVERGKEVSSAAKTWAIGQLVAARQWLSLIANPALNHEGAWPEFTLYDCYSCHQLIGSSGVGGVSPGTLGFPRPAMDSLVLARLVVASVAPGVSTDLAQVTTEIAAKSSGERMASVAADAARGRELVDRALAQVAQWNPSAGSPELRRMLAAMGDEARAGGLSYAQAAQRYMAAQSLVATLEGSDALRGDAAAQAAGSPGALGARLDPLFKSVQSDATYSPDAFRAELVRLTR